MTLPRSEANVSSRRQDDSEEKFSFFLSTGRLLNKISLILSLCDRVGSIDVKGREFCATGKMRDFFLPS